MKRNNILKSISTILILGLISVFTACSHSLEFKSKTTQIKPLLGNSERTVFPDFNLDDLYGIKLEAKANGSDSAEYTELAIWDSVDTIKPIDIEPGTYNFCLTAYQGEVKFIATKSKVKIEKGKVNPIKFALVVNNWGDPTRKDAWGYDNPDRGNINLTVKWDANVNAISNSVTLSRVDTDGKEETWYTDNNVKVYYDNESKNGGWYINFSKYDLVVGEYRVDFVITDENYKQGYYSDYIIVAADCTSRNTFEITQWSDMYAVASVLYTNESPHLKAETVPEGVKFTISYKEGDPDYWLDLQISEAKSGIRWVYSVWDSWDDSINGRNKNWLLGKDAKALKKIEVIYPLVEKDENYIFNIELNGGKIIPKEDTDDEYRYEYWTSETVVATAGGGDLSLLDDDSLSDALLKLQKCGIATTEVGASMKFKYDITRLFDRNADWDEFRLDYRFHSGLKSEDNRNWDGVWQNFDCNLLNRVGLADYEYLKPDSDGLYITDQNSLNELQKKSTYFTSADFYFRPKEYNLTQGYAAGATTGTRLRNAHYKLAWQSEETPYTIAKMNKITIVKDLNAKNAAGEYTDVEEFFYPTNTKVTLKNPVRSGGWVCEDLYEKDDFTGNPVSTLSGDCTLYAKWGLVLSDLDNQGINKMQLMMKELKPDFNDTLKKDQLVAITLKGHAVSDFNGPIRFQIWNTAIEDKGIDQNGNETWPGLRGRTVINQKINAGQDFTMCFGIKVQHPWHDEYNGDSEYAIDIQPENLFIQIEYDKSDYEPEFKISNPQITFDTNPIMYTYVLSGAEDDVGYGAFEKDKVKTLPTTMDRWNKQLVGWYDNANLTGTPVTEVAASDNGPKTFYAKWDIKFERGDDDNYYLYTNIKDYQPNFNSEIDILKVPASAQDSKMIVYMVELTATPNINFSGSVNANIHIPSRHRNNGDEVCICTPSNVFKGDSGHWTITNLEKDKPVKIRIPVRDWVNPGEGGYTVKPEEMNFFIEYWDDDCNQPLVLSNWKFEVKPAIEIYYKLDDDDHFRKDGKFIKDNMDARIYKYYTVDDTSDGTANGTITLLTEANRPGFSRKLVGWHKWNESLNNGEGGMEDVPNWKYADGNVELKAKWSLVFTGGQYENYGTHDTSYNYGTDLTFNSIDFYKFREETADENGNVWECGNKPNLEQGNRVTVILEGTPTANIPPANYGIIAQLYDKKWNEENNSWISTDTYCENRFVQGENIKLAFDFDIPWTSEHNYEDLAVRFVYDTGNQRIHDATNGEGLNFSVDNIWYDILTEKVKVTYDYGYKVEEVEVYKDGWYELPTENNFGDMGGYEGRKFLGWYIADQDSYKGSYEGEGLNGQIGWDCLKADGTIYKAKWEYKMVKGGWTQTWDPSDPTYRRTVILYETRLGNKEIQVITESPGATGRYAVLEVTGKSEIDVLEELEGKNSSNDDVNSGELAGMIGWWDDETNKYYHWTDWNHQQEAHANAPFKFVYQFDIGQRDEEGILVDQGIIDGNGNLIGNISIPLDKVHAVIKRESTKALVALVDGNQNEVEPIIEGLTMKLYVFDTEAKATAKFEELNPSNP